MHQNFHGSCQGLQLAGAAWQRGSGQEGVSAPGGSYPAHKEKPEPKQGPVFTAECWDAPGLPKIQLPWWDLASAWKGWVCFSSSCTGAERSGHSFGL